MNYGADPRPQIREEGSTLYNNSLSWQEWTHPELDRLTTDLSAGGASNSLFCGPAHQGGILRSGNASVDEAKPEGKCRRFTQ